MALFIVAHLGTMTTFAEKQGYAIAISHFGTLTEKQASDFIQRMMEYSLLHEKMQSCRQDAYAEFIASSNPTYFSNQLNVDT